MTINDGTVQEGRLHVVTIDGLAELARRLPEVPAAADDAVLVLPPDGTLILGSFDELIDACLGLEGGICVAASPVPLSSTSVATKMADAVARATGWSPVQRASGWRPARVYPYPYALLGPHAALVELSANLFGPSHQSDADVIASVLLKGTHPLVLDTVSQVFHVLDGTGTDAVAVAGRAHSAGEQPLVVVDPSPQAAALARLQHELDDTGARDLARVLRYDGAVDFDDDVIRTAHDILVTRFWTSAFCATIIRAAESAGIWAGSPEGPGLRAEVRLEELSPRLRALVEEDLETRIWPLVVSHWPNVITAGLQDAVVVRHEAGEANVDLDSGDALGHVSGAVRLNDGYHGGGLFFPRQRWDNREAPIGSLTIWPSAFSHPHRPESVTRGVEYQLILRWQPPRGAVPEPTRSDALPGR
jgi:hypothetical protein